MERWQRELVRNLFPYSASRLNIERAFIAKHPHVPPYLYKYRKFSPQHLDALDRGVLHMSSPDRFNDPFDTTIFFDPSRFLIEDLDWQEFIDDVKRIEREVGAGKPWEPKPFVRPILQRDWLKRTVAEILRYESPEVALKFEGAVEDIWRQQSQGMRSLMSQRFRSLFSVLSLAANAASPLMWSHYSDGHRGFCIEYDFGALAHNDLRKRLCFPVFYRGKRTDATRYMANPADYNNLFSQYMCLLKSSDWAYEREWRIVHTLGAQYANRPLEMPTPRSIIVGACAKPNDLRQIESWCSRRSIPLKHAVLSDITPDILVQ